MLTRKFSPVIWIFAGVALFLIVVVNSMISRNNITEFETIQERIHNSSDVLVSIESLHINVLVLDRALVEAFVENQPDAMDRILLRLDEIDSQVTRVSSLSSEDEVQQGAIQDMLIKVESYTSALRRQIIINQKAPIQTDLALLFKSINQANYDEIRDAFRILTKTEASFREIQIKDLQSAISDAKTIQWISFSASALAILGVIALARFIIRQQYQQQRDIEKQNTRLQEAVEERTAELSLYSQELARSNRELEDFAFVASHDLQEPLRKIRAFGDRLSSQFSNEMPDKAQDYLARMQSAAGRMSKLISDLLDFSRVHTQGRDFVEVELADVFSGILDDLSEAITDVKASILVDTNNLPIVTADPMQMHQLFYNLMNNALKFSSQSESPQVQITVSRDFLPDAEELGIDDARLTDTVDEEIDCYVICIQDNGIGFDQSMAEKIFAPFQRLHTKNEYSGTGIGLSICRRIAERHNGAIQAYSQKGEGAKFCVYLPINNTEVKLAMEDV